MFSSSLMSCICIISFLPLKFDCVMYKTFSSHSDARSKHTQFPQKGWRVIDYSLFGSAFCHSITIFGFLQENRTLLGFISTGVRMKGYCFKISEKLEQCLEWFKYSWNDYWTLFSVLNLLLFVLGRGSWTSVGLSLGYTTSTSITLNKERRALTLFVLFLVHIPFYTYSCRWKVCKPPVSAHVIM